MIQIAVTYENVLTAIANFFELIGALIIFTGSARVAIDLVTHGIRRESPTMMLSGLGTYLKLYWRSSSLSQMTSQRRFLALL
jgi:hypothetical protein